MELKEGEVYVPTVLNESTDEAITLARESGLTIQIVDKVSNDKVDANKVMKQTPEGGKIAKKGDVLQVVVSKGKEQVTV
ncbi:PASTA domain-containing protein, partial [Massilicoli timonensis]